MKKSLFSDIEDFDQEVEFCLEYQLIPAWEEHGLRYFMTSEQSLEAFESQPLSSGVEIWAKPRTRKRGIRKRHLRRQQQVIEQWPEDDLHSVSLPMLCYVRSGTADVRLGDYVARIPPQHFLLFRPDVPRPAGKTPYYEEPRSHKKCELWRFTLFPENDFTALSVSRSEGETHANSGQYYIVNSPEITQQLFLFTREVMERRPGYERIAPPLLQSFLHLFLREIKEGRFYNRGVSEPPDFSARIESPIDTAKSYISKNLNRKLTIDIVSRAVFMSRANFTSQFREATGQTFNEYLTNARLQESKLWLERESCSIEVVCKYVGLKSTQFHHLFKHHFGMTPTEYRKFVRNRNFLNDNEV